MKGLLNRLRYIWIWKIKWNVKRSLHWRRRMELEILRLGGRITVLTEQIASLRCVVDDLEEKKYDTEVGS